MPPNPSTKSWINRYLVRRGALPNVSSHQLGFGVEDGGVPEYDRPYVFPIRADIRSWKGLAAHRSEVHSEGP